MSREIPGSAFEQGDGERRTWDEMGWWEQPFSADEDDHLADDEYIEDDEDDPTTLDGWLSGWSEPLTAARERWLLEELDAEARDLRERIYYRDMAAAAGGTVDDMASAPMVGPRGAGAGRPVTTPSHLAAEPKASLRSAA